MGYLFNEMCQQSNTACANYAVGIIIIIIIIIIKDICIAQVRKGHKCANYLLLLQ